MTLATQATLRVFLEDPAAPRYGVEIARAAGIATGTLHPILTRLERLGWLESAWENLNPSEAGRPRRRYYRLSPKGTTEAQAALERVPSRVPPQGKPAPTGAQHVAWNRQ